MVNNIQLFHVCSGNSQNYWPEVLEMTWELLPVSVWCSRYDHKSKTKILESLKSVVKKFNDTKSRKEKRTDNAMVKRNEKTNNDQHSITQKTKYWTKNELMFSGRVRSSFNKYLFQHSVKILSIQCFLYIFLCKCSFSLFLQLSATPWNCSNEAFSQMYRVSKKFKVSLYSFLYFQYVLKKKYFLF